MTTKQTPPTDEDHVIWSKASEKANKWSSTLDCLATSCFQLFEWNCRPITQLHLRSSACCSCTLLMYAARARSHPHLQTSAVCRCLWKFETLWSAAMMTVRGFSLVCGTSHAHSLLLLLQRSKHTSQLDDVFLKRQLSGDQVTTESPDQVERTNHSVIIFPPAGGSFTWKPTFTLWVYFTKI